MTTDPHRHGTRSTYTKYGCRCPECRVANTEYNRDLRRLLRMRTEDAPHGTNNGYTNWGCRCVDCAAAKSESNSSQYRARKATS